MTATLRKLTVLSALFFGLLPSAFGQNSTPSGSSSGSSKPDPNAPLSSGQLSAEFQKLSPDAKAALLKQLGTVGSKPMSEDQMKSSFNSLPDELKSQLQAKWDGLSDEQRIALKKMNPDTVKQMVGQMVGQMAGEKVQQAMAPVQEVVEKAKSAVEEVKTVAQKTRAYVQNFLGKIFGSGDSKPSS